VGGANGQPTHLLPGVCRRTYGVPTTYPTRADIHRRASYRIGTYGGLRERKKL